MDAEERAAERFKLQKKSGLVAAFFTFICPGSANLYVNGNLGRFLSSLLPVIVLNILRQKGDFSSGVNSCLVVAGLLLLAWIFFDANKLVKEHNAKLLKTLIDFDSK